MNCKFCQKECKNKNSLIQHEVRCKLNENSIKVSRSPLAGAKKGCTPWNKGLSGHLSQETIEKLKIAGTKSIGKSLDPIKELERKQKISNTMKKNPLCGGLRIGSGRGIKGYYNGIWCDSSWELAWVLYAIDNNIKFERNTKKFKYIFDNNNHYYIPDFYLIENDSYVEIKGRRAFDDLDIKTKTKIITFSKKLEVLYYKEMIPILEYVKFKHGSDFINLYDR